METVAIILSLLGTSAMLAFLASQFKSGSDGGSKYAAVMKILFNSVSFTMLLFVPVAGLATASQAGLTQLESLMGASVIPVGFLFVVFVFYLLWEYLSDLIRVVSGSSNSIENEEFR